MIRDAYRSSNPDLPTSSAPLAPTAGGPASRLDAVALAAQVSAHVTSLIGEPDPEFTADLVATFVETAREALAEVEAAFKAKDGGRLGAAAHQLRGSASNVGLTALTALWAEIDEASRQGGLNALFGSAAGRVQWAHSETIQTVALLAEPERGQ